MNNSILALIPFGLVFWFLAAWMTHLIVCFSDDRWGFLIGGALFFPIALVHGTGVWFGAW